MARPRKTERRLEDLPAPTPASPQELLIHGNSKDGFQVFQCAGEGYLRLDVRIDDRAHPDLVKILQSIPLQKWPAYFLQISQQQSPKRLTLTGGSKKKVTQDVISKARPEETVARGLSGTAKMDTQNSDGPETLLQRAKEMIRNNQEHMALLKKSSATEFPTQNGDTSSAAEPMVSEELVGTDQTSNSAAPKEKEEPEMLPEATTEHAGIAVSAEVTASETEDSSQIDDEKARAEAERKRIFRETAARNNF